VPVLATLLIQLHGVHAGGTDYDWLAASAVPLVVISMVVISLLKSRR
jgi:hypothetical protein